jgi:hypothetical protein
VLPRVFLLRFRHDDLRRTSCRGRAMTLAGYQTKPRG